MLPDERTTFPELAALTRVMARRLRAAGVEHGDRVGLLNTDRVESLAMLFGAMRIGAVPVPVNARYKARELSYVVAHAGMHLLLLDPQFAPLLEDADLPEHCRVVIGLDDPAFVAAGESVDDEELERLEAAVRPDDPALILYTSGTTANPKGCVYNHDGMATQAFDYAGALELTPGRPLLDAATALPRQRPRHTPRDSRRALRSLPRGPALRSRAGARAARARAVHASPSRRSRRSGSRCRTSRASTPPT